ncbi:MAG: hypothetical protein IKL99_06715 [Oscillospiraceae bacterium]|nr:hypothetical protein [Oscillospiraceae bacterium]
MKNMMKKTLAALAALAIMLSVTTIPVIKDANDNTVSPLFFYWDEDTDTNRD